MTTEARIAQFLSAPEYRPLRRRALAEAMGVPKEEYRDFAELLNSMVSSGALALVRGRRYAICGGKGDVTGVFEKKSRRFGFVRLPETGEPDVYIGPRSIGSAMDGDTVAVALGRSRRGVGPQGRIVRVIKRARDTLAGTFSERGAPSGTVRPDNFRIEDEFSIPPGKSMGAAEGEKVLIRVLRWPGERGGPCGEIVERLGPAGDTRSEIASIARSFNLAEEFSPQVLEEARAFGESPSERDLAGRRDLSNLTTFTIDPADAADFDDAVSIERTESGLRLGVHIADVSHYVREGTALDKSARSRGNSAYLPGYVLPMLPHELSSNLCSLRPGEPRLTRSVFLTYRGDGEIERSFERTHIKSASRLTYEGARLILEEKPDAPETPPEVREALFAARGLAAKLRAKRMEGGSIDLDLPEVRVTFGDDGEPKAVVEVRQDFSHQLIEEFMLAANRAVAELLAERAGEAIWRVHEDPDDEDMDEFADFLGVIGMKLSRPYDRHKLRKILEDVSNRPDRHVIHVALLRALKQAQYSATCSPHYALAFNRYCHFTSPIRRYPDLVVHRVMGELFPPGGWAIPKRRTRAGVADERRMRNLAGIAEHCSRTERLADDAEREAVRFGQLKILARDEPAELDGLVTGVKRDGLVVEVAGYMVTGFLRAQDLLDDWYRFDRHSREMTGYRKGGRIRVGTRLKVKVARIDLATKELLLAP